MLTVIVGRAQFLEFSARDPARLHRTVDAIVEAAKRIDSEACALLAGIPRPGQARRTESIDLSQLISWVVGALGEPAMERVRVSSHGPAPDVYGDPGQLRSVFSEVIASALRSAGLGCLVSVDIDRRQDEILVTVANGERRAPVEDVVRVSRGGQEEPATGQLGLNLGFWVAKRLVEANGGRLRVAREDGSPDTYLVSLPG